MKIYFKNYYKIIKIFKNNIFKNFRVIFLKFENFLFCLKNIMFFFFQKKHHIFHYKIK